MTDVYRLGDRVSIRLDVDDERYRGMRGIVAGGMEPKQAPSGGTLMVYPVRIEDDHCVGAPAAALEPLRDGDEPCRWEDCVWQPEEL